MYPFYSFLCVERTFLFLQRFVTNYAVLHLNIIFFYEKTRKKRKIATYTVARKITY